MRYEAEAVVLAEVFGESSSSEDDGDDRSDSDREKDKEWESMEEVKGLWLCRNFLSDHQQSRILTAIESDNWFPDSTPSINQAMRFGVEHLPRWAIQLSDAIHRSLLRHPRLSPFPLHRKPLFDQLIANLYHPGEGICAHVDLLRFDDGIAILSLESSCVMHFTYTSDSASDPVPVLLAPGSLVLMSGDARYNWKHEINRKPGFQIWQGQPLTQSRRISITLRKLCPTPP